MAKSGTGGLERGSPAPGRSESPIDSAAHPSRMDLARRFIADINNHPLLRPGRNEADPVQIIDLAPIREALGAKWDSYTEIIHRVATRTIEKHLDGAHSYVHRDDCYVLTFKGAQPQTASDRTRAIALALATYLFGTGMNDAEPMAGHGRTVAKRRGVDLRGRWARILDRVKSAYRFGQAATARWSVGAARAAAAAIALVSRKSARADDTPRRDPRRPPVLTAPHGNIALSDHPGSASGTTSGRRTTRDGEAAAANGAAARLASPAPAGSARTLTPSSSSLSADHVAPSRAPVEAQVRRASTKGRAAPQPLGAEAAPPVITADFTSPSQPEPSEENQITALEDTRVAAGERTARDPERHGPDRVAQSRAPIAAPLRRASTEGRAALLPLGAEATPPIIMADRSPPSQPEPLEADDAEDAEDAEITALENAMIAAGERLARESARHGFAPPIRGLHYFYRPMWSVRTNMMAISSCVPIARRPSGELVTGGAVVPYRASSDFLQKLDHAALTHALSDGQKLAEAARSTLVSIPVHYETLCDRERRAAYLKMCQGLPPGARRRILFECLGIQQGMGQSELLAGLLALKPFCALTVGQLPLDASSFTFWKTSGLSSVGVDISDQIGVSDGGETELIERLERFVFSTSQIGLRSYVRGLNTLSLAAAAVAAGFDFVEGGIIQDQIEPSDVRPFTLEDLYLQFAGARRKPTRLAS